MDKIMHLVTDLLGKRCQAFGKQGWIGEGGEPQDCEGTIHAIAFDRDFVLLVMDQGRLLHRVQTLTHHIHLVP